MEEGFRKLSRQASSLFGTPWSFVVALGFVLTWAFSGPLFAFSSTWQLFINTGTTIMTFLMVFLIQNTQNRDARAIHLKLDELIEAVQDARNDLVAVEESTEDEMKEREREYAEFREKAAASGGS